MDHFLAWVLIIFLTAAIAVLIAVLVILIKRNMKSKASLDGKLNVKPMDAEELSNFSKQILEYKGGKKKIELTEKNRDEIIHFVVFFLVTKLKYDENQIKDFLFKLVDKDAIEFMEAINNSEIKKYLEVYSETEKPVKKTTSKAKVAK